MRKSFFLLVLCVTFFTGLLSGQEITATITGAVTDSSGGVIAGAKVTATNLETNLSSSTTTNSTGDYVITLLRPGHYKLNASQAGFKEFEQSGIALEINQRAKIDIVLSVGQISDKVEITEEAPIIETEDSAVGKVIDNKSITQLPLNGRVNIMGLMALAPGIQNAGAQDQVPYYGITPTVSGGSSTGSVGFTLDGVTNQLTWIERGLVEYPPLDGLQEFKVITNGASAEFGKANQVVVVSRSGSNQLHGELYEYNRNRELTAKNFFAEALPNPAYNRNEYGANFGGPVVFPHLYNGRNRTFFFVNYEGFNLVQASTSSQAVPTVAQRSGNFAGLPAVTDPFTGAPFPGNVIPTARLNPVDQKLLQLYPLPNTPGTGAAGTGVNLVQNIGYLSEVQRGSARFDHHFSDSTQLGFSFLMEDVGPNPSVGPVSTFGGLAGIGEHLILPVISLNHVFSPTVVSETRLGYQHQRIFRIPQNFNLGSNNIIPGLPFQPIDGAPQISITNIVSMSEAGSADLQQDLNLVENLTIVRGKHSLKTGFNYEFTSHYNIAAESPQRGAYNFNGQYSGNAVADFVLGYPVTTQLPSPAALIGKYVASRYAAYLMDDWKVTPKLTVNLGIRYELQVLRPEIHGDAALFIPSQDAIAVFANAFPPDTVASAVAAYPVSLSNKFGLPTSLTSYIGQNPHNFAPRVGLAYLVTPKTVFRSGFGIYYNVLNLNYTQSAQTNLPFLVVGTYEQPAGKTPGFTMSNPFPGSATVPANPNAQAYNATRTPYNIQWNATLEHQLAGGVGLRVSYVGQRNVALLGSPNINQPLPTPGPVQPVRPYQPFANITLNGDPIFQSSSNQLQGGIEKRYNNGFLITAQYQYSRAIGTETFMSPINYNDSRGNLANIRRHVLVTSYVYDLPFGKGRPLFSNATNALNNLIGGWQISGLVQALSGAPFSPSFDTSVQGSVAGRPNVVLGTQLYPGSRTLSQYFNAAAFMKPPDFTFGNAGYNQLWGPGQYSWDMGLAKNIKFVERVNLELRMDAFSVFNHPTFANPASDISNTATVGRITSAGGNRTIQLGARLSF